MMTATADLLKIYTPDLDRDVYLRPKTSDEQTWGDTFGPRYHAPPLDMPTPKIVLDLGANIGLTAAHYKTMWPDAQVWMIEPNPDNMELAKMNAPNCPYLLCAVARDSGWYWLREEGLQPEAYTLADIAEGNGGCRSVYAIGMAHLVSLVGGKQGIDFVKMDIEGAEWEILGSVWENDLYGVRHLLVELHGDKPPEALRKDGMELLREIGFEVSWHEVHPTALWARIP